MWSIGVVIYVLLSGLTPFYDSNMTKMFLRIVAADFEFGYSWMNITQGGKVRPTRVTCENDEGTYFLYFRFISPIVSALLLQLPPFRRFNRGHVRSGHSSALPTTYVRWMRSADTAGNCSAVCLRSSTRVELCVRGIHRPFLLPIFAQETTQYYCTFWQCKPSPRNNNNRKFRYVSPVYRFLGSGNSSKIMSHAIPSGMPVSFYAKSTTTRSRVTVITRTKRR